MTAATLDDLLTALDLDPLGPGRWRAGCVPSRASVVFGGQLVGQAIVAATAAVPVEAGKRVKSAHTVFARAGRTDDDVSLDVERLHDGRSFAGLTVTARQGERVLAQSLILLDNAEEDLVRHGSAAPATAGPLDAHQQPSMLNGWDHRYVENVDLLATEASGPPTLAVWSRFATERREPALARALLGWASASFLVGTAMRPHRGLGLARAHRDLSTAVLTHTLTFHDEFTAGEWLLLIQQSTFAGGGRAYGTGEVFTEDGRLVASYAQESLLRRMATADARL